MNQFDLFLDIAIIFGGFFTLIYSLLAYTKFNKGEFKNILAFVMGAYFFAYMHAVLGILGNYTLEFAALDKFLFFVAMLFAFVSGRQIYEFSKAFGFENRGRKAAKKKT